MPPISATNTDPFGPFFSYAARCWTRHLGSAPVDFNLDDVLKLASHTSARCRAWALESGWDYYWGNKRELKFSSLDILARYGNVSMLEQLLDRLALNSDRDRISIVDAAGMAILGSKPRNFRAFMNHQSTARAMQTFEMLKKFTSCWKYQDNDNLEEWTELITGLFDMLASDKISLPNDLLGTACGKGCMPIVEKLFERAKAGGAFQTQLLQPTGGSGPLGAAAWRGSVELIRYLCQQDGMEAHASNRDILADCGLTPKVEIIKLLFDKFPRLVSEGGDQALFRIVRWARYCGSNWEGVESAKLLLHHTQGPVDVDELLAEAVRSGWPDMCRMLLVDGHANAQTVVKRSSSGRLELKEHCLEDRRDEESREPDEKVLEAIAGCLPDEVLEGITAVQETEEE